MSLQRASESGRTPTGGSSCLSSSTRAHASVAVLRCSGGHGMVHVGVSPTGQGDPEEGGAACPRGRTNTNNDQQPFPSTFCFGSNHFENFRAQCPRLAIPVGDMNVYMYVVLQVCPRHQGPRKAAPREGDHGAIDCRPQSARCGPVRLVGVAAARLWLTYRRLCT